MWTCGLVAAGSSGTGGCCSECVVCAAVISLGFLVYGTALVRSLTRDFASRQAAKLLAIAMAFAACFSGRRRHTAAHRGGAAAVCQCGRHRQCADDQHHQHGVLHALDRRVSGAGAAAVLEDAGR